MKKLKPKRNEIKTNLLKATADLIFLVLLYLIFYHEMHFSRYLSGDDIDMDYYEKSLGLG